MRAVVQRVTRASVTVENETVGAIERGFLVLLGVERGDGKADAEYIAEKCAGLRVFEDEAGKFNRSLQDVGGAVLLVSQFTLCGDARKGRRPSFTQAEAPEAAERLFMACRERLLALGVLVETGRFRTHMEVSLVNDGPVTILLDSRRAF